MVHFILELGDHKIKMIIHESSQSPSMVWLYEISAIFDEGLLGLMTKDFLVKGSDLAWIISHTLVIRAHSTLLDIFHFGYPSTHRQTYLQSLALGYLLESISLAMIRTLNLYKLSVKSTDFKIGLIVSHSFIFVENMLSHCIYFNIEVLNSVREDIHNNPFPNCPPQALALFLLVLPKHFYWYKWILLIQIQNDI